MDYCFGENLHCPWQSFLSLSQMSIEMQKLTVDVVKGGGVHQVHLTMSFPTSYPNKVAPEFHLSEETTLDRSLQQKLIEVQQTNKLLLSFNCLLNCGLHCPLCLSQGTDCPDVHLITAAFFLLFGCELDIDVMMEVAHFCLCESCVYVKVVFM